MELTKQQEEAFTMFKEFVDSNEKHFLLTGCAGSGKSFLTRVLVEYTGGYSTCVLAPTHKALGVIKEYLQDASVGLEFSTVAKFLFKKQVFRDDGQVSFMRDSNLYKQHDYDYIFIDEASMIDSDDFHCLQSLYSKVVFIGDSYQLPPVGERNSIVFDCVQYVAQLTETVRTSHDALQDVYNQFRNYVYDNDTELELDNNDHLTVVETRPDFYKLISENFKLGVSCKVIAYRNVMVERYNQYVRTVLFKSEDMYVPGEQLIFTQQYADKYTNNTEVVVKSVKIIDKVHPHTKHVYQVYELTLDDDDVLYKVTPTSKDKYNDYFNDMLHDIKHSSVKNKSRKWAKYYLHRFAFDPPIVYSYALTAYKCQGSTIDTTFIDLDDVYHSMVDKDELVMKKAMYTSITRASNKLFILL